MVSFAAFKDELGMSRASAKSLIGLHKGQGKIKGDIISPIVAQLEPALAAGSPARGKPWERMRGRGKWLAAPGETFIKEKDLKGL